MKLLNPLKIFLSAAVLAGGAQAASLSLGPGGLTTAHANGVPNTTLTYVDPSGIVIHYSKSSQANFTGGSNLNSRGWSNDSGNADVLGFAEIAGVRPDHLAIAHFNGADKVIIDFTNASNVNMSTAKLVVWDLDTNITNQVSDPFTEIIEVYNGSDIPGNFLGTMTGSPTADNGSAEQEFSLAGVTNFATLTVNSNPVRPYGLSAFTVTWDPVPEPSTSLLALLGGSFLFLRRRR